MTDTNRSIMQRYPLLIPGLAAAAMLLAALAKWPYGYYVLLRWIVCGVSVYAAFVGWAQKRTWAVWPLAALAILFNPIVPIHLSRGIWQLIDVGAAVLLGAAVVCLRAKPSNDSAESEDDK